MRFAVPGSALAVACWGVGSVAVAAPRLGTPEVIVSVVPRGGDRRRVRISASAVDDARHRAMAHATFLRGPRAGLWCLAPTPRC